MTLREEPSTSRPVRRVLRWSVVLLGAGLLVTAISGCGSVGYVSQSAWGGLRLMAKREPIERVLRKDRVDASVAEGLRDILEMREFASRELALPDNKSYRSYVDVGRPWVTWSVTAAPTFAVEPLVWCFPVAGCVSYRGYFSQKRAERFAERLRRQGYDVASGPITAFSTLGWFADPVLSTFLERRPDDVAGLVFHELSHQVLYVKGDTTFNESFATAVEILGQRRWLEHRGRSEDFAALDADRAAERRFVELVLEARSRLATIYAEAPSEAVLDRKREAFDELRERYEQTRSEWDPRGRYARWFERDLNNAHLAQVGSYHEYVEFFLDLFERSGDFEAFYVAAKELAERPADERRAEIESAP